MEIIREGEKGPKKTWYRKREERREPATASPIGRQYPTSRAVVLSAASAAKHGQKPPSEPPPVAAKMTIVCTIVAFHPQSHAVVRCRAS
ncbi:hypothetical protein SESBI_12441 [Sesbania bispinosa]|nr:hypothetical protein SESBI_12441 [Sesbania bispinosa]